MIRLVLVDLTAIATIRLLSLEWLFTTKLYRFAVTQGTWEELHDTLLDDHQGSGRRANMRFEKDRFVWQEQDAAAAEQLRLENQALLDSFRENVQLLPATELAAVLPEERNQMKECFGVYGAETMAVAGKDQHHRLLSRAPWPGSPLQKDNRQWRPPLVSRLSTRTECRQWWRNG